MIAFSISSVLWQTPKQTGNKEQYISVSGGGTVNSPNHRTYGNDAVVWGVFWIDFIPAWMILVWVWWFEQELNWQVGVGVFHNNNSDNKATQTWRDSIPVSSRGLNCDFLFVFFKQGLKSATRPRCQEGATMMPARLRDSLCCAAWPVWVWRS